MSNQVIERKQNGQFAKGVSGNLGGNAQRTRHLFNKAFLEALAEDFRIGGPQAIAKVRKESPAAYMKICALLVPREHKVEHSNVIKSLSDQELEAMIEHLKASLEAQAQAPGSSWRWDCALWVIRDEIGLKGTKFGCGIGTACVSIQAFCSGC